MGIPARSKVLNLGGGGQGCPLHKTVNTKLSFQLQEVFSMTRAYFFGLGAVALVASTSVVAQIPVVQNFFQPSVNAQELQRQQKLRLQLDAEKQVIAQNQQGKQTKTWQPLKGQARVMPGDVLRYTISGENTTNKPIKNLTINQPIPQRMEFVLKSVIGDIRSDSKITYSINGGRSFVEKPTVKVTLPNGKQEIKPAPANAYTHIRMQIPSLEAKSSVKASYQVQVK
jgi:uncharacterized repeat protein (TIGR01451 family)